jgi:hypothetical protein
MQDLEDTVPIALTGVVASTTPSAGEIHYTPTAADTAVAGSYMANWQVTWPLATFTAATALNSPILTGVSSEVNLADGVPVSGPGIPPNTYVLSVDSGSQVTLTNPANAVHVAAVLTPGRQLTFPISGYLWVDIQPNLAGEANLDDPTQNVLGTAEIIRPSVSQLAAMCRGRTVAFGSGGSELGEFTSATHPTYAQADDLIDQAVAHVMAEVGFDIPDWTYAQTRQVVLLYAARLVEVTFYALSVSKGDSPFEAYSTLYTEALGALGKVIESDVGGAPHQAIYSMPVMTRRQARYKDLIAAGQAGDFTLLPDDMYYPMGPKGLPWNIPGNSEEWDAFDWSLGGFDSWMGQDV